MKVKILGIMLFFVTAGVIIFSPLAMHQPTTGGVGHTSLQQSKKIEVVFVLDTTGSMGGLIDTAKQKIWSIASSMAQSNSVSEIKIGLVGFRDRGDAYVTKVIDLSSDLDTVYASLLDFTADGGGDGPESVNQALYEAVNDLSWSTDDDVYRVVFLVGDAPPHMDYHDDVKFPETLAIAKSKGIVVNTIQCGGDVNATTQWQQIASLGDGAYFQVEQAGGAIAITTPYDEQMAQLSVELDATRMFYGDAEQQEKNKVKARSTDKLNREATDESKARRAKYNVSKSGKVNQTGDGDLIDDVTSGRIVLDEVDVANLPAPMAAMPKKEREDYLRKQSDRRQEIEAEIVGLSGKRDDYINKKLKEDGGSKDSLDEQIYSTVKTQAADIGIVYEAESAAY